MSSTLPLNEAAPRAFAPIRPRPVPLETRGNGRRRRIAAVIACSLAVVAGVVAGILGASGHSAIVFVFPALLIPVAIWKWDEVGVIGVLAIATVVEQNKYVVAPGVSSPITQNLQFFHSITQGSGVSLFELLLLLILLIWVMKGALRGTLRLPHSGLSRSVGAFVLLVLVGFGVGLSHGGSFRWAMWEVRPFIYLGAIFWLSASLLHTRRALRAVLWTLVLGSGFKALQGVPIYLATRHLHPRPEYILAHEESFFFGLFIFLTLGLWIFQQRGALRTTATALLPVVLLSNLANTRRTAWAILALGLVALLVIAYASLPHRRRFLRRLGVVLLVGSAVYIPAYWNSDGTIGQPAHAIHSEIQPDARDLSSNLYRVQENANLQLDIRQSHDLGTGFGVPIDYSLPIQDIRGGSNAILNYTPHDDVLYVWLRLGIVGEAVFLMMIAAAIFRAVELARVRDQELAFFGMLTVCAVFAYLVIGYEDMGFTWFRVALCMGILFGATEAALRLARRERDQPLIEPVGARHEHPRPWTSAPNKVSTIGSTTPSSSSYSSGKGIGVTTSDLTRRPVDSEELAASVPVYRADRAGPSSPRQLLRPAPTESRPEARDAKQPGGQSAGPSGGSGAETETPAQSHSADVAPVARKNVAFNVSWLAGGQVITWSLALVWTAVVPRLLGPSVMGEIVAATSVASILGVVLGLGTKQYLVREIVVAPSRAPRLIGSAIVLRTCLIPVFAAAVIVYSRLAHFGQDEAWVLYLATGATVLYLLTEPIQAAFQSFERMEYLAYSNAVTSALQTILGVTLALIGFRAVGLSVAMVLMMAAVLLFNALWARKLVRIDLRTTVHEIRSLVTDSLAYWSFAVLYVIYFWIDTVILSLMTDSKVVGWYGVTTRIFTTLMMVPQILGMAWLPRLVTAFQEAPGRLYEAARRPIEIVLLLGIPICVLAAMTAGPVVRILFGPSYAEAAPILAVFALALPLMYLSIMLNQVAVAAKRQSVWTWIMAGATVVNLLLNIALIPLFQSHFANGAIGAAVALWLTELLIVVVGFVVVGRKALNAAMTFRLLRAAVAGGAMWAVMYATRPFGFVTSALAGALVFSALVPVLRLASPEDWTALRQGASGALDRVRRMVPGRNRLRTPATSSTAEGVGDNA